MITHEQMTRRHGINLVITNAFSACVFQQNLKLQGLCFDNLRSKFNVQRFVIISDYNFQNLAIHLDNAFIKIAPELFVFFYNETSNLW